MADSALPELSMYWTSPPNFLPFNKGSSQSGSTQDPLPPHGAFHIGLGSLRAMEETLITSASAIVNQYTTLKTLFLADKDWVYGQTATVQGPTNGSVPDPTSKNGSPQLQYGTSNDPIHDVAIAFANGDGSHPGINELQQQTLLSIANGMGMLGEFIAAVNNAGQAYASADFNSIVPGPK